MWRKEATLGRLSPCSMYVMNPRDISTAPRWKLKPCQTEELETNQSTCWHRHTIQRMWCGCLWNNTHMQQSAGCICHHDSGDCSKFESTLKNICENTAWRWLKSVVFKWAIIIPLTGAKQKNSCCHKAFSFNTITHRCAESQSWAGSTMLPLPPLTWGTLYPEAWIQSCPCKIKARKQRCLLFWITKAHSVCWCCKILIWPFEVFFLLGESRPGQSSSCLAQITNKIIAEVERHGALIGQQPPRIKKTHTHQRNKQPSNFR